MATSAAAVPPQEQAPLSEGARLINVFIAPSKTFTDLKRSAAWWAPFLITAIVSIAFVYVADQKVGFRKIVENQLRAQPKQAEQLERMDPDQREKNMTGRTIGTKWISYGFFVLILGWHALVAGVLLATLKFGFSSDVKFKTLFALVIYAGLPGLIKVLLAMLALLAGVASDGFTFQNPVATNPGYFLDPAANPMLYALLTSFDVFTIWTLVIGAIGLTCVTKIKSGTAYAIVFGWFAVLVLIGTGVAAAFA